MTVSDNDVVVQRALTYKDGWIIGMVQIESFRQERVLVHVVDEFPDSLPVETTGFKRGIKRKLNEISAQEAAIKLAVEDEPVTVTYGIKLAETVGEVEFDPPTIQHVEPAETAQSAVNQADGCGPAGGDREGREDLWNESVGASARTAPTPQSPSSPTSEIHDDPAVIAAMQLANMEVETEAPNERNDDRGPPEAAEGEGGSAVAPSTDDEDPGAATGDHTEERQPRRSVETRIDWLSARVDKFAAYSTALEEFIDDNGTASEFIDQIEGTLEEREQRLQSVEREVETLRETHGAAVEDLRHETGDLDRRIDEARQTFETEIEGVNKHLGGKIAGIETDITAQSGAIGRAKSDIKELDDRVTGVRADLDEIRESVRTIEEDMSDFADELSCMRREFSELRADLDELSEFKESLAGVFDSRSAESRRSPDT